MAWLRIDDQRCLNRKIGMLTDGEYRALDGLYSYLTRARVGGEFTLSELPFALYITPSGPKRVTRRHLEKFLKARLIDKTETGYKAHDWDEYQPKDPTAADRMRRHRARNNTVTNAVTENVTDRNSRADAPSRPLSTKPPLTPPRGGTRLSKEERQVIRFGDKLEGDDREMWDCLSQLGQMQVVELHRRVTGLRYVRGSHGSSWRIDVLGTDPRPSGVESNQVPPAYGGKPSESDVLWAWSGISHDQPVASNGVGPLAAVVALATQEDS